MRSCSVRQAALFFVPLIAGGLLVLTGCPTDAPVKKPVTTAPAGHAADDDDHDHAHHHHHHDAKGPHGGALVAIGDDDAHLEFVLDTDSGKLTAYVLDGAAEKSVAIKQASLQLAFSLPHAAADADEKDELPDSAELVTLAAVSPSAEGTASEFAGESEKLKGVEKFDAALTSVSVGAKQFKDVNFKYPEGNEEEHHH